MSYVDTIAGLFSQTSYLVLNIEIARYLGINAALVYSSLLCKYRSYKKADRLLVIDGKDYFYSTINDLSNSTTLTRDQQDRALDILVKEGLIEKKNFGIPAKRHFHLVNTAEVNKKILEIVTQSSLCVKHKLDCKKSSNSIAQTTQEKILNKNSIIKNNNKRNIDYDAVNNFRSNYSDDFKLCQKIGVDPIVVSQYFEHYSPNVITDYLQFIAKATKNSRINNPTGLFITAIQQGYDVQPHLHPEDVPTEVIEQTEKDMRERLERELAAAPPMTPDSPFYKYQHRSVDEHVVIT